MNSRVTVGSCDVGLGVFCNRPFNAGEVILEFIGEEISLAEAIAKGDRECDPLQIDLFRYLDLSPPAVYLNHSCEPNSGILDGRWLVALRPILSGEELRYDYSTSMSERRWTMPCSCGAANCRRVISDFHMLPEPLQTMYAELKIVMPFILRERDESKRVDQ